MRGRGKEPERRRGAMVAVKTKDPLSRIVVNHQELLSSVAVAKEERAKN